MNMSPARRTMSATSSAGTVSGRGPCGPGSVAVPLSRHRAGALRGGASRRSFGFQKLQTRMHPSSTCAQPRGTVWKTR